MSRRRKNEVTDAPLSLYIVRYGLFAALLLPLFVLSGHLFPKESGKIWGFMFLIQALAPFAVCLAAKYPEYRPARGLMTWAVLGFIAVMGLGTAASVDPVRSLWSTPSRLTGVIYLLHGAAFYLMATQVWRGYRRPVIGFSVMIALLAALIGIWQTAIGGLDRAEGTFLNAVFLAQYLVPHVFLAVWLAMTSERVRAKRIWIATAGVIVVGLLATKSRAGMVGLALGTIVAFVALWRVGEGRMRGYARRGLAAVAILLVLFALADRWAPTHEMLYERRMSFQNVSETVGPRLIAGRAIWQGVQERPWLGWGPDTTNHVFDRQYAPELLRYDLSETRWDRAHSVLLEQAVAAGIPGVLAYLALFAAAGVMVFRSFSGKEGAGSPDPAASSVFFAAPIAIFGVDLFLFGTAVSWTLLFLLFALIVPEDRTGGAKGLSSRAAWALALIIAVISVTAFEHAVRRPWTASARTDAYLSSLSSPPPPDALMERAEKILEIRSPHTPYYARLAAPALRLPPGEELGGGYGDVAMRFAHALKDAADRKTNDFELYLGAAKAVASVPLTDEVIRIHEESVARMHELSPDRQEVLWLDGFFLARQGRLEEAEAAFEAAVALDPEAGTAHEMLETFRSVF